MTIWMDGFASPVVALIATLVCSRVLDLALRNAALRSKRPVVANLGSAVICSVAAMLATDRAPGSFSAAVLTVLMAQCLWLAMDLVFYCLGRSRCRRAALGGVRRPRPM